MSPAAANASVEEIAERYHRASEAQSVWAHYTLSERVNRLRGLWHEIQKSRGPLLELLHEETGKPSAEIETLELCPAEIVLNYFTGNAHRVLKDRAVPRPWLFFNKRAYVRFKPRGVAGIVSAWQQPFLRPFADAVPALLAGNAAIVLPSPWAPRAALWLEEKIKVSGLFPEDLFQVTTGAAETATLLAGVADILLFTGSGPEARAAARAATDRLKPVVLELGGKHPMVVLKDAFLERAAKAAVWGRFADAGQLRVGVGCVYVEEDVYAPFCAAVENEIKDLRRDGGADEVELGRMIHPTQFELAQALIKDAVDHGARVVGGEAIDAKKLLMAPAAIFDAKPEARALHEECFGPVLAVVPAASAEEAMRLAEQRAGGLAVSLWSRDVERAERLAAQFETGLVGVNDLPVGEFIVCSLPFGGVRESGLGRRHSEEGLRIFCYQQSVLVHEWPPNLPELWWYPYRKWKTRLLTALSRWA